jgi:hypothetical protein
LKEDEIEYETIWSGADELLPPRDTQPDLTWQPPRRLYNKKPVTVIVNVGEAQICQVCGGFVHKCEKFGHIKNVTGTGPSIPDGDSDGND